MHPIRSSAYMSVVPVARMHHALLRDTLVADLRALRLSMMSKSMIPLERWQHSACCVQSLMQGTCVAVSALPSLRLRIAAQMATVLFYLTDVEEGGQTVFPLEGQTGLDRLSKIDYRSCKDGFKVCAAAPRALISAASRAIAFSCGSQHVAPSSTYAIKGQTWRKQAALRCS